MPLNETAGALMNYSLLSKVSMGVPLYLACILEYFISRIVDSAGNSASSANMSIITPREVESAVRSDANFYRLFYRQCVSEAWARREKSRRKQSFEKFVGRVAHIMHPNLEISLLSVKIMDAIIYDLFEGLIAEASRLAEYKENNNVITCLDLQTALRLLTPAELAEQLIEQASLAMPYDGY